MHQCSLRNVNSNSARLKQLQPFNKQRADQYRFDLHLWRSSSLSMYMLLSPKQVEIWRTPCPFLKHNKAPTQSSQQQFDGSMWFVDILKYDTATSCIGTHKIFLYYLFARSFLECKYIGRGVIDANSYWAHTI